MTCSSQSVSSNFSLKGWAVKWSFATFFSLICFTAALASDYVAVILYQQTTHTYCSINLAFCDFEIAAADFCIKRKIGTR